MTIPNVAGHTATEPFLQQVLMFGESLVHFRGRETAKQKQMRFDASFERGDRRAALEWLREYCRPGDTEGLRA